MPNVNNNNSGNSKIRTTNPKVKDISGQNQLFSAFSAGKGRNGGLTTPAGGGNISRRGSHCGGTTLLESISILRTFDGEEERLRSQSDFSQVNADIELKEHSQLGLVARRPSFKSSSKKLAGDLTNGPTGLSTSRGSFRLNRPPSSRRGSVNAISPKPPSHTQLRPQRTQPTFSQGAMATAVMSKGGKPALTGGASSAENLQYSRCGSRQSLLNASRSTSQNKLSHDADTESQHHHSIQMPMTPNNPANSDNNGQQQQRIGGGHGDQQQQHHNIMQRCSQTHPYQPSTSITGNSVNATTPFIMDKRQRNARKKDIQKKLDQWDKRKDRCHWSFVFDPAGRLCYYWSMVVSMAFLYNFWVIIFRFSFAEISKETVVIWFSLDYIMDLIYILDIVVHFRTGYLEDGVLQTDSLKLRQHYMNSTTFYIDCLSLLPLDFLYLSLGIKSILRIFRLVKVYQFWAFMDRSERHTNYPNLLRFISLIHNLLLAFHWNACFFHLVYYKNGFGSNGDGMFSELRYPVEGDSVMTYLKSLYWTTLAMTTIGDLPRPAKKAEIIFVIVELLAGLITFALVLGYIANIVTNVSAARKEFQAKLDGVKTYMRLRRVPKNLQNKVIKWFDYLWLTQKSSDEEKAISCLPDKLKGEIAIHVHLDTLKRVEIFQNTEAGFLCELVLRLRPVLFSPGDYICRKGEVGKEMYICARGRLEVVADEGKTILATLKAGSYFGEISILNMGTAGNRRTASVRSVGYSDLFVLSKKDMWDVLKDYPAARVRLEAIAVKRLEKYKKAPLEKAALPRSESTPGLVESSGMVPLEEMWVSPLANCDPEARERKFSAHNLPWRSSSAYEPGLRNSTTKINNNNGRNSSNNNLDHVQNCPYSNNSNNNNQTHQYSSVRRRETTPGGSSSSSRASQISRVRHNKNQASNNHYHQFHHQYHQQYPSSSNHHHHHHGHPHGHSSNNNKGSRRSSRAMVTLEGGEDGAGDCCYGNSSSGFYQPQNQHSSTSATANPQQTGMLPPPPNIHTIAPTPTNSDGGGASHSQHSHSQLSGDYNFHHPNEADTTNLSQSHGGNNNNNNSSGMFDTATTTTTPQRSPWGTSPNRPPTNGGSHSSNVCSPIEQQQQQRNHHMIQRKKPPSIAAQPPPGGYPNSLDQIKQTQDITPKQFSSQQTQPSSIPQQAVTPKPPEELLSEIRRLRERIKCLEGDNAAMHFKLTKTQRDVDQRLTEIEHQMEGQTPEDDDDDANEEDLNGETSGSCSIRDPDDVEIDEDDTDDFNEGRRNLVGDIGNDDENEDLERNQESFI